VVADPWAECERERIPLFEVDWLPAGIAAVYERWAGGEYIALRKGLTRRAARCALTEELVHRRFSVGNLLSNSVEARQEEVRTKRRVAELLISERDAARLVRRAADTGDEDLAQWAEDLDVTEAVLRRRLAQLKARGWVGWRPWWDE
jgi:hypothetical protein